MVSLKKTQAKNKLFSITNSKNILVIMTCLSLLITQNSYSQVSSEFIDMLEQTETKDQQQQFALADTQSPRETAPSEVNIDELIPFSYYANEFTDIINELQLSIKSSYNLSSNLVADSCSVIMDKNQLQGPIGQYVTQVFKVHETKLSNLVQGGSLNSICPGYAQMSLEKKSYVWTLILASMAHFESTCNTKAPNKGPNGTAYGYYQLHKGKEDAYDLEGTGLCTKNASGDPKLASKCALSMLERQFIYEKGLLFSPKSYWDVLRPRGRSQKASLIRNGIMKSSLCRKVII